MPNDPSHFVAIELDDRIFDFDLLHCCCLRLIRNFRDERISLCFSPVMEAARLHSQSVFKFVILVEALEGQENLMPVFTAPVQPCLTAYQFGWPE
jgi:hypothetical protein